MPHLDDERLALISLGEPADAAESAHLDTCDACTADLLSLTRTVAVGRSTALLGELETPPERVWDRIAADVADLRDAHDTHDPLASAPSAPLLPPTSTASDAAPRHARSRRAGALTRAMVALAASAVLVLAIVGTWALVRPIPPTQIAAATLDAFPAHPRAEGTAVVVEDADGERVIRVALADGDAGEGYREVWLITADASALVSLGVLDAAEGDFAIPDDIDLREYVLVDVSLEPLDGDPEHSGDSIVRGELDFA